MQTFVNLIHCRSLQEVSKEYLVFTCKTRLRYSRGRESQSFPRVSQTVRTQVRTQVRAKVRINIGLTTRHSNTVGYYLTERFRDIIEARKVPERIALFRELPANLLKEIDTAAYNQVLRLHPFFGQLTESCMSDFCSSAKVQIYVHGDIVRMERPFRSANDASDADWKDRGIRFVLRGCLHSTWQLSASSQGHFCEPGEHEI